MAEQDRKDLVPSVLNDLIDVDGTPVEGNSLTYTGAAWEPTDGPIPPNGPVINVWDGESSGSRADNAAIATAWNAIVMSRDGYDAYPGVHPTMGAWIGSGGYQQWNATEPGNYAIYVISKCVADGIHANGYAALPIPLSRISNYSWGSGIVPLKSPTTDFQRHDHLTMQISQGMIDAGFGGFDVRYPSYFPGSTERINVLRLSVVIERYSPGSTFDYYGDL